MAAENASDEPKADLPPPPNELNLSKIEELGTSTIPSPAEMDISFFSHRTRKSTQLIGNKSSGNLIKAKKEWLSFDLIQTAYVTSVKVYCTGYEDYHEMEISFVEISNGATIVETAKYDGSSFSFEPKRFIGGFGIRPSERFWKTASITRIEVQGVEQKFFSSIVNLFENLAIEKDRIESSLKLYLEEAKISYNKTQYNISKIAEQSNEIEANNSEIEELNSNIQHLKQSSDEIDKRIAIGVSVENERNERVKAIELSINKLNSEREEISSDISKKEAYLREIKNNINLFPTEIAGYVKQGTNNIRLYAGICVVPLLIIGLITIRLFANSEKLLNFFLQNHQIGIVEFLISRIPYVAISASVLVVCYSILYRLISEILNINRKRQDLYKISIIATDVSYASQEGMELTNDERYELRTQTKIEMLKEHLKHHMSEDYLYAPSKNYASKILSLLSRRSKADNDEVDQAAA
ncbi:hypothetical protein LB553_26495 [Mesorhizobium sp. CA8]|uniref:hypothetical protein n=1 Tax=Mesorhizobium sp. CA8 TaxID=2876637 RepID=UPI001CCEB015|nr:hypothetical protein [Mesorhizobium sp. CA8]MBZ9764394.1 hypothetical protein [Mesorhizobium sp. CA8]